MSKKQKYNGIVYSTNEDFNYSADEAQEAETLPPGKQQLRVSLDKKQRGGKAVTLVSGFIGRQEDLVELGKHLKQRCGVGGTVKEGDILIQGDFRGRVTELLINEGYRVKQVGG